MTRTAGRRSAIGALVGFGTGAVASLFVTWQAALLIGWDGAALVYLAWTWKVVAPMDAEETQAHSLEEDPSRPLSEATILVAGVALLAAVGLLLVRAGHAHGTSKAYFIGVGILSVVLSWATVHTIFSLRYARQFYGPPVGGVEFNEDDPPAYLDFAYLSFTIGMTFQVSDTNLTTKPMRRIALHHALLSYLFGAVIVALSINLVATLL